MAKKMPYMERIGAYLLDVGRKVAYPVVVTAAGLTIAGAVSGCSGTEIKEDRIRPIYFFSAGAGNNSKGEGHRPGTSDWGKGNEQHVVVSNENFGEKKQEILLKYDREESLGYQVGSRKADSVVNSGKLKVGGDLFNAELDLYDGGDSFKSDSVHKEMRDAARLKLTGRHQENEGFLLGYTDQIRVKEAELLANPVPGNPPIAHKTHREHQESGAAIGYKRHMDGETVDMFGGFLGGEIIEDFKDNKKSEDSRYRGTLGADIDFDVLTGIRATAGCTFQKGESPIWKGNLRSIYLIPETNAIFGGQAIYNGQGPEFYLLFALGDKSTAKAMGDLMTETGDPLKAWGETPGQVQDTESYMFHRLLRYSDGLAARIGTARKSFNAHMGDAETVPFPGDDSQEYNMLRLDAGASLYRLVGSSRWVPTIRFGMEVPSSNKERNIMLPSGEVFDSSMLNGIYDASLGWCIYDGKDTDVHLELGWQHTDFDRDFMMRDNDAVKLTINILGF